MHSAFVPQGLGLQGSGFSLQPVIVSGAGSKPSLQVHTGLPCLFTLHWVFRPHVVGEAAADGVAVGGH